MSEAKEIGLKEGVLNNFIGAKKWALDIEFGMDAYMTALSRMSFDSGFQRPEPQTNIVTIKGSNTAFGSQSYKIKEIKFNGVMYNNDTLCEYGVRTAINDELYKAYEDPTIQGILLIMNTGGGESSAAVAMDNVMRDKNKPVMVYSELLASGGIWGTLGATEIMASHDGLFGSVGVYFTVNNKQIQYLKDNFTNVYATQSTKKQKMFRALMNDDITGVTEMVDEMADVFINKVKPRINANHERAADALAGDTFDSQIALELGLVNSIGTKYEAMNKLYGHIKAFNYLK